MASTFTWKQFEHEMRADGELPAKAVKVIRTTVKLHGPAAVQGQLASLTRQPVDRGAYKGSFRFEDIPGGAVAYNFAMYAAIIEYGRRPGSKAPPIEAITQWVLRKGLAEGYGPRQRGTRARRQAESRARGIAFVIARNIKRRGLPAHLILEHASEHIDREIDKALMKLLDDDRA